MDLTVNLRSIIVFFLALIFTSPAFAQSDITWSKDGSSYFKIEQGELARYDLPSNKRVIILDKKSLTPSGMSPLELSGFDLLGSGKVLVFTNTQKVWRYNTRGDYWIYDSISNSLTQLGKDLPAASLMFAKLNADGTKAAYVSKHNIYVEDLARGKTTQLTTDGSEYLINGTFDWAYEEEFFLRDGFRWSPDGKSIAFWQVDASQVKKYLMINNTDSAYPFVVPVEYPVAGESPSPVRVGAVRVDAPGSITWMNIPGDHQQHYLTRMEWIPGTSKLIAQQLNRKQNESKLFVCNTTDGVSHEIYNESDKAWIDIQAAWDQGYADGGWDWLGNGKEFLWSSEKDGWRHLYRLSTDGKKETLLTRGAYDVMDISLVDDKAGYVYFMASPTNATQKYLYRTKLDGSGKEQRLTPVTQPGTHKYDIAPGGRFAFHSFSNYYTPQSSELLSLPDHKSPSGANVVNDAIAKADKSKHPVRFFTVHTGDGVDMDAWMVLPKNFDSTKKYPVVFYVYTEPWGQNVIDRYGSSHNFLYKGDMAGDGYIYISMDNRGTPAPKGREWRKSIYRKIGLVNIHDQAMGAKDILKFPFVDSSRVAVWGWSGGGTATLNLMFQYPEIYKTGISIAAVGDQLTYDNIYQERYMGLPQENLEDFIKGSPITYAKNLKGNLLYIHGTGDDNVHYKNAELLINELVKYNRQFQVMPYPNRTHSISEGEGTYEHLSTLYTEYLRKNCPPGGR
ncbi:MAG TPA: DPP IV N-terminal domain-containing protein [Flavitalea sp.]|nr:DPP IV N-terminal domain-containing protein [Flavitalea sp.]